LEIKEKRREEKIKMKPPEQNTKNLEVEAFFLFYELLENLRGLFPHKYHKITGTQLKEKMIW